MAGALLMGRSHGLQRIQLLLKSLGRIETMMIDVWPDGSLRGFCDHRETETEDLKTPGQIRVMRSNEGEQPYTGVLPLIEGGIAKQLESYLSQSEQIQASVTMWIDPLTGQGGAFMVEPLPQCPPKRLARLIHAVEGFEVVLPEERTHAFIASWINGGAGAIETASSELRYECRCSKESLIDIMRKFSSSDRDHLFSNQPSTEVHCDYCANVYQISVEDLLSSETSS